MEQITDCGMSDGQTQPNPSVDADSPPLSAVVAETDGVDPPDEPTDETCMICGLDGPVKPVSGTNGVFSDAFTTYDALGTGDGVCWRCEYLSDQTDYRRYHWVATESDGIRVVKERPELLDVLLDPPEESWLVKYKDESDFLTVLNGWIVGQTLNTSRERYRLLVDKRLVDIDRDRFADMIEFGRELRDREDAPAKRVLLGDANAADLDRYDVTWDEVQRINNDLAGREDWRIAVQLIQ